MVITARTRNAVTALSGTRVRIPSLPPVPRTRQRLRNQIKGLTKTVMPFFLLVALPDGIRCTSTASGRRNNVAFRFTTLTAARLVGRIPSLPPVPHTRQRLRNQKKGLTKTVMPFFLLVALPDGIRCTSTASGRRNNVAFRFTALTAERLVGRIPSLPPKRRISRAFNRSAFSMPKDRCLYSQAPAKVPLRNLARTLYV